MRKPVERRPPPHPLARALVHVREWPVRSQLTARRNALLASTALAQRRREYVEAEEFLAHYLHRRQESTEAHSA